MRKTNMRTSARIIVMLCLFLTSAFTFGQTKNLNVFEAPKDISIFDGVKAEIGGAFALQFQVLDHSSKGAELVSIGNNFNLATANLDINAQLGDGLNLHIRTYLSSRHHSEAWVKGGYLQIDKLNFIKEGFAENLMKYTTIKFGHMEINYGDQHFRRSDNASSLYNPFVGNTILDAFTTEVGVEVLFRKGSFLAMGGLTNGKLNQGPTKPGSTSPSIIGKVGFDKQVNDDTRVRLTSSIYHTNQSGRVYLYSGDRTGSRYYGVLDVEGESASYKSGRFDPGFSNELTAIMVNPFVKYKGLEFFGLYEITKGKKKSEVDTREWNHSMAEVLYRFGGNDQLYIGGRYNKAKGLLQGGTDDVSITRNSFVAGWFLTKNILTKLEYVDQKYDGFTSGVYDSAGYDGFVVEAVISF